ncbi:MAG: altronate dehydratase [Clostridia bacterium]|nr:altronate dehydratase [Clostridia bacterium]
MSKFPDENAAFFRIHPADNVEVSVESGHKRATCLIAEGERVIKYGSPIGIATRDIAAGEWVHSHNLASALRGLGEYGYEPVSAPLPGEGGERSFLGYEREDGSAGIRNEVWIINTVGCVNKTAQRLADKTGAFAFPHPFGCSQLGDDLEYTQRILKGLVCHPNAAGVLVLGLGCENNNLERFCRFLGEDISPDRIRFLNAQDAEDEMAEGETLIGELFSYAAGFHRTKQPLKKLKVGLKCGGSDGFSGITANPLVGRFSDLLIREGGSTVLTEVPEMFGAEHLFMERCRSREIFDKTVALIRSFREYYLRHGQRIDENPSPGNREGGITTLEEKSLGCIQKGGLSAVMDVLEPGEKIRGSGLHLLSGPGNDGVAVTNLAASGAQMILFTTGHGTPLGAPVPTVKISTNTALAQKKPHWIDFDGGELLSEGNMEEMSERLMNLVLEIAEGKEALNEKNGYREIAIFKNGVTL